MKLASLNFHDSASTALIDDYYKMLLDIINYQKSEFRRKSVVLILVKIKQFIVLIDNAYVRAWHRSACNQRLRPVTRPGYGVENRKPMSKIRTHLGLFFVIARKKEVDWLFVTSLL